MSFELVLFIIVAWYATAPVIHWIVEWVEARDGLDQDDTGQTYDLEGE